MGALSYDDLKAALSAEFQRRAAVAKAESDALQQLADARGDAALVALEEGRGAELSDTDLRLAAMAFNSKPIDAKAEDAPDAVGV